MANSEKSVFSSGDSTKRPSSNLKGRMTLSDLLEDSPSPPRRTSIFEPYDHNLPFGSSLLARNCRLLPQEKMSRASSQKPLAQTALALQSSKLAFLDSTTNIDTSGADIKGKRKLKRMRKEEREKTKGAAWFHMGAPELTDERKNDLEALRLRGALDTKRFYKRNNITTRPKYFQVGRILDSPADYYNSRVPKKQRKNTVAEEMVAEVSSTVSHL